MHYVELIKSNNMLINADIGEMTGNDADIMQLIELGNIACGSHASNPEHMAETVQLAISHGVKISAHPGYADRENFGRLSHTHTYGEILELVETQVQLLKDICAQQGTSLYAIKPHGALYHDMMAVSHVRDAIESIAQKYNLPLIVPAVEAEWSVPVLKEVFADRAYDPDGTLIPRSVAGSLYLDEKFIIAQARQFDENEADTLCFHGDNPASVSALHTLYARD